MFMIGRKNILGFDLGSRYIKVVEIKKGVKGSYHLKNYAYLSTPIETYAQLGLQTPQLVDETLASLIKELLVQAEIKTKEVALAIPLPFFFHTFFQLPPIPERDLKKVVHFESRRYIPLPLNEVEIFWKAYRPENVLIDKKDSWQIFTSALPKNYLRKYQQVFQMADLKLKYFEPEIFSFLRTTEDVKETHLIVDFGSTTTLLIFAQQGKLVFLNSLSFGGFQFEEAIARSLNISLERAEEIKQQKGLNLSPEDLTLKDTLFSVFNLFVESIKKEINQFENKYQVRVEKIFLSGGNALIPGMVENFAQQFPERLVSILNPFRFLKLPVDDQAILARGPIFSQAVGGALNFYQH